MTPAQFELLQSLRRTIAEMQTQMDAFQEADMRILSGNDDVTEAQMQNLAERIERLEAVVEKNDPTGATVLRGS